MLGVLVGVKTRILGIRIRASGGEDTRPPAEEFAPLAAVFRRRILVGTGTASVVALGANFAGITSFLLGFSPELGRRLRLDAVYPVRGYTRCVDFSNGFEFIYPTDWVGDQTLLYRAISREESKRQLDPPPLDRKGSKSQKFSEPVVAFGPPGSNGELNVSVIVSPVPPGFSIEVFGGPEEIGQAVVKTLVASSSRAAEIKANLIKATVRRNPSDNVNYYELEFGVEGPSFQRHNVAVCCANNGMLFTLNAQSPESTWPEVQEVFYKIAESFSIGL